MRARESAVCSFCFASFFLMRLESAPLKEDGMVSFCASQTKCKDNRIRGTKRNRTIVMFGMLVYRYTQLVQQFVKFLERVIIDGNTTFSFLIVIESYPG